MDSTQPQTPLTPPTPTCSLDQPDIPIRVAKLFMRNEGGELLMTPEDQLFFHAGVAQMHSMTCYDILSKQLLPECVNAEHLALVNAYMYTGHTDVPTDRFFEFNELVSFLQIDSLMKLVADNIDLDGSDEPSVAGAPRAPPCRVELVSLLKRSINAPNAHMERVVCKKIAEVFESIPSDELSELPVESFKKICLMLKPRTTFDAELKVFQTINKFFQSVIKRPGLPLTTEDHAVIRELKSCIDFDLITPTVLIDTVRSSGFLTDAEYIACLENKLCAPAIYICCVRSEIPTGFRKVTAIEFSTGKFKRELIRQLELGLKIIGSQTDIRFMLIDTNETVSLVDIGGISLDSEKILDNEHRVYAREDNLVSSADNMIVMKYCTITTDGFLCVKNF